MSYTTAKSIRSLVRLAPALLGMAFLMPVRAQVSFRYFYDDAHRLL